CSLRYARVYESPLSSLVRGETIVMRRCSAAVLMLTLCCLATLTAVARAETIARCGQGWLERVDGYLVLHLKGTPYEMGYQHGALLKDHIRENLRYLVQVK